MSGQLRTLMGLPLWFWALMTANLLVTDLYWLYRHLFPSEHAAGCNMRCMVMLLCPVVGPLYFFFSWLYYRVFFRKPVDLDDVIFSKDRAKTLLMAEDRERDFVPLEEAMAVTDKGNTRTLMIEIVRRDISNSLSTISLALNSDDSEVAHYAATVLQETLGNLRISFQKLWRHICELEAEVAGYDTENEILRMTAEAQQEDPDEAGADAQDDTEDLPENAVSVAMYREEQRRQRNKEESYRQALLARDGRPDPSSAGIMEKLSEEVGEAHELQDDLRRVLFQDVLSEREQKTYTDMMEEVSSLIDRRDILTAYELDALISALLRQGEYERCRSWCERSAVLYPMALISYTGRLRLCYALGDREGFFEVLDELKRSQVPLDHETLEMIRVFL